MIATAMGPAMGPDGGERVIVGRRFVLAGLAAAPLAACGGFSGGPEAPVDIDAFFGSWQGTTITGAPGRPLALSVGQQQGGNIVVDWIEFEDDPAKLPPDLVLPERHRRLHFNVGRYTQMPALDAGPGEEAQLGIEARTLVMTVTRRAAGHEDVRTYRYTLAGPNALALEYSSVIDTVPALTIGGTLNRIGGV
jgi:hypothetical protein